MTKEIFDIDLDTVDFKEDFLNEMVKNIDTDHLNKKVSEVEETKEDNFDSAKMFEQL